MSEQLQLPGIGAVVEYTEAGDILKSRLHRDVMEKVVPTADRVEAIREELRGILLAIRQMQTERAELNQRIEDATAVAQTFQDALDRAAFPLPKQEEELPPGSHS